MGSNKINLNENLIKGKEVLINNENFYKISNVNKMRPFFMSIVSAYDHWLFISSTGALSAGRKNSDNALFLITQTTRYQNHTRSLAARQFSM